MKRTSLTAIGVLAVATLGYFGWQALIETPANAQSETPTTAPEGAPLVNVVVPELAGLAKIGEVAFNAKCAACHGNNAAGKDGAGPPLVHKIYEPSHHGDAAFQLAAQNGVRAHHWPFGNMAPVTGVTGGDIKAIVAYVRSLQRANGIF